MWTDKTGRRLPTSRVSSGLGPQHCSWEDMRFLRLDGGDLEDGESYVEHPEAELYPDYFTVAYTASATLPPTPAIPGTNGADDTCGSPATAAAPSSARLPR